MQNDDKILMALAARADEILAKGLGCKDYSLWQLWLMASKPSSVQERELASEIFYSIIDYYGANLPVQLLLIGVEEGYEIVQHGAASPVEAMREYVNWMIDCGLKEGIVLCLTEEKIE